MLRHWFNNIQVLLRVNFPAFHQLSDKCLLRAEALGLKWRLRLQSGQWRPFSGLFRHRDLESVNALPIFELFLRVFGSLFLLIPHHFLMISLDD
jgi:hypothetical protein